MWEKVELRRLAKENRRPARGRGQVALWVEHQGLSWVETGRAWVRRVVSGGQCCRVIHSQGTLASRLQLRLGLGPLQKSQWDSRRVGSMKVGAEALIWQKF